MQVRRCSVVLLEPREVVEFELSALLTGGSGLRRQMAWFALAPHLDAALQLNQSEREFLGSLSPSDWIDASLLDVEPSVIQALMEVGLVLMRGDDANPHSIRDARLRAAHWHPLGKV